MSTLVTILHVIVCLFLMLTVLLQQGKGGGMGGAFGGSNAGSVFGGAGASTFLRRLTAIAATVFMATSMVLAFLASRDAGDSLEKYSNSEASRKKRAQEAEKRAFENAQDAGTTPDGDAGVGGVTTTPASGSAAIDTGSGAAGAGGVEVPIEIPAAGSAAPAGSATPPTAPPPAAPPAGSAAPAAPVAPAPGSAHP